MTALVDSNLLLGPATIRAGEQMILSVIVRTIFRPLSWKLVSTYGESVFFRLHSITIDGVEQLPEQLVRAGGPSFGAFEIGRSIVRCGTLTSGRTLSFVVGNESSAQARVEILIAGVETQ